MQGNTGNTQAFVPEKDEQPHQNTPEAGGKMRGAGIEMLQNPFYKRMQGEVEAVLECHLKKTHHLRYFNGVGGHLLSGHQTWTLNGGPYRAAKISSYKGSTRLGPPALAFCTAALKYSE